MKGEAMVDVLQHCSLHSLLLLTSKVLSRSGYGDVQILDRRERRQKSRHGGHEILCESNLGPFSLRVIVKVINDTVRMRMLDELAGAVLRSKADLGIIVSPHNLTASAARHQAAYYPARIEVMSGDMLAAELTKYRIGVRPKGTPDYQFFDLLDEMGRRVQEFIALEGT